MNLRWLLMAKRWAQNPPSMGKMKFVVAIVLLCIALYAIERIWGWPDWLTPDRVQRRF
ncbi:MAG: hypothetical protein P8Q57_02465 [Yoonia sp.]|nr:hypothetical protein [Yoonia sp.]